MINTFKNRLDKDWEHQASPLADRQKIITGDYVGDPYPIPNLVQIRSQACGHIGEI